MLLPIHPTTLMTGVYAGMFVGEPADCGAYVTVTCDRNNLATLEGVFVLACDEVDRVAL